MKHKPQHRNALIYCADENVIANALYSASHAALRNPDRSFDILICSLTPLTLPPYFLDLGIIPVHLDLKDRLVEAGLRLNHLPLTTYLRLWLPEQFADTYERIFYVDTDIVDPNLSDFTALDLGPHAIGGVRDVQQWTNIDRPIHEFDKRGLGGGAYMNGGVLLIDTEAFNSRGLLARLLETNQTMAPFIHHDQSLVNLTLRHEWAELHPHWNWQGLRRYPVFTAHAAPRVLHFVGPLKPSHTDGTQMSFTHDVVAEYADFLARHFPDKERPVPPSNSWAHRARVYLRDRARNVALAPQLKPLSGRFRDDMEVFT